MIGELARHTGVPAKTVRFYHSIGLLAEAARDASGYRRYTAADAIALLKIRALAEAGVPLARIPALLTSTATARSEAIEQIEHDLELRIGHLQETRRRLQLLAGPEPPLPPGVADYLALLRRIGLSPEWVSMEADLWILAFTTHPDAAAALLADQREAKTQPAVQAVYRDYDKARELDPDDPQLNDLADRILAITRERYAAAPPPAVPADSPVPDLIQSMVNSTSPAWRRLDRYLRRGLAASRSPAPGS